MSLTLEQLKELQWNFTYLMLKYYWKDHNSSTNKREDPTTLIERKDNIFNEKLQIFK